MSGAKRSLPSWTNSREKTNTSGRKKKVEASGEDMNNVKGSGDNRPCKAIPDNFLDLLEGVVFVLSGFVNPERSTLRSQAMEMGAEYRPDWTLDCTLLVCAFQNTPKFRQVASDGGTIISKEWISECYNQKKLVDIEPYLMHAGKPWRKNHQKAILPDKPEKMAEKRASVVQTGSVVPEGRLPSTIIDQFSPGKIKEWAIDDLRTTMSWLESQENKPEKNELKAIAAEGIITCLQDAIESLKKNQDVRLVTEQWMFVPKVVKELAELDGGRNSKDSLSKDEISELALTCKKIYEREFDKLDASPSKKHKSDADIEGGGVENMSGDAGYDSDRTIEMTEEEIELAYKQLS